MKPAATERRRQGRYYTPEWLAREMTTTALARFRAERDGSADPAEPLRILDPSCGEGVFLVVALRALCADIPRPEQWRERCEIAHHSLHGADCDEAAIARARDNLVDVIAPPESERERVREHMASRFRRGDALLGIGWEPDADEVSSDVPVDADITTHPPIDWHSAYPDVCRSGGFDLILGNPPYRRERDSRVLFERIARSPLGERWRQPRMDLWHYFAHRALDLLKTSGRLAFVVSGYWSAARSAGPLIQRLQRETTFEEIQLLGNAAVFPGVTGRHMTFQVRKGSHASSCLIREAGETRVVPQRELFAEGRLVTMPAVDLRAASTREQLGDRFEVRQGIAENPPRIAAAHIAGNETSVWRPGEGVFVLTHEELAAIAWNDAEQQLFRPCFSPAEIDCYRAPQQSRATLLYLTRRTAPTLDGLPHIAAHLARFRPLLERRREVRNGRIAWWHLHWPREERLFVAPRILAVQMVREPRFCVATAPTFVGFSTNVIGAAVRSSEPKRHHNLIEPRDPVDDLHALCGLLNSSYARDWFQRHAKRRGVNLDIGGTLLREFPLPEWENPMRAEIGNLARRRSLCASPDESLLETEIDHVLDRWMR